MVSTRGYALTILAVIAMFTIFKSGNSLFCYECNSHINKNCSLKKPPNSTIVDCDVKGRTDNNKYTMCRKIHQTIDFEVNGLPPDNRIIRSCAWDDSQYKDACYSRSGFGGRQDACTCSKDLCNSSISMMSNRGNVIVYFALSFALIYITKILN